MSEKSSEHDGETPSNPKKETVDVTKIARATPASLAPGEGERDASSNRRSLRLLVDITALSTGKGRARPDEALTVFAAELADFIESRTEAFNTQQRWSESDTQVSVSLAWVRT